MREPIESAHDLPPEDPEATIRILAHDPRMVGLRDAVAGGWYQSDTGEIVKGFCVGPGNTVLDVGCGGGGNGLFALRQGARVLMADVSDGKFSDIRKVAMQEHHGAPDFIVCDAQNIPLGNACVDRIVATEMPEHTKAPVRVLEEFARISMPGGLLLLTVPDSTTEAFYKDLAPPRFWQPPNHIHVFDATDIESMLAQTGWTIVSSRGFGFYWTMTLLMHWLTKAPPNDSDSRTAMDHVDAPHDPLVIQWSALWNTLMDTPKGVMAKRRLDALFPRSRIYIARHAGSAGTK